MRVDGKFVDSEGNVPSGQYVRLLFPPGCFVTKYLSVICPGTTLLVKTMLWHHLPTTVKQRAR